MKRIVSKEADVNACCWNPYTRATVEWRHLDTRGISTWQEKCSWQVDISMISHISVQQNLQSEPCDWTQTSRGFPTATCRWENRKESRYPETRVWTHTCFAGRCDGACVRQSAENHLSGAMACHQEALAHAGRWWQRSEIGKAYEYAAWLCLVVACLLPRRSQTN